MNIPSVRPSAQFLEGQLLGHANHAVHLLHGLAGAPAHDRSRDVTEVARLRVAGKDVENDRLVRAERAVTTFVRVAALIPAGDDGV